jgi:hypothetical protein
MKITTYVELTPAQEKAIEGFQDVVVKTALARPFVVATFTTFLAQEVKVTLSEDGAIENVAWGDKSL